MASKAENISKAREHWENRKIGRPVQVWKLNIPTENGFTPVTVKSRFKSNEHVKGAIPGKF